MFYKCKCNLDIQVESAMDTANMPFWRTRTGCDYANESAGNPLNHLLMKCATCLHPTITQPGMHNSYTMSHVNQAIVQVQTAINSEQSQQTPVMRAPVEQKPAAPFTQYNMQIPRPGQQPAVQGHSASTVIAAEQTTVKVMPQLINTSGNVMPQQPQQAQNVALGNAVKPQMLPVVFPSMGQQPMAKMPQMPQKAPPNFAVPTVPRLPTPIGANQAPSIQAPTVVQTGTIMMQAPEPKAGKIDALFTAGELEHLFPEITKSATAQS